MRHEANFGKTVALAFSAALVLIACGQPLGSAALSDVVRNAETAQLNATDPPAGYIRTGDAAPVRQLMVDRANAELARFYADPALARELSATDDSINQMLDRKGGGRAGGVTDLELTEVQISGNAARAKARVTVWFKTAQFWWQDPHTRPSATNVIELDLHFVRRDGVWKIDQETWQFAPGGGP